MSVLSSPIVRTLLAVNLGWISIVAIKDLVFAITWPARVIRIARTLSVPFRVSISLDDIIDRNDTRFIRKKIPRWQYILCLVFSASITLTLLGLSSYLLIVTDDRRDAGLLLGLAVGWLYTSARFAVKSKPTPPYGTLLFVTGQLAMFVVISWLQFRRLQRPDANISSFSLSLVGMLLTGSVVAMLLTRPLLTTPPTLIIAPMTDDGVSDQYSFPEDGATLWNWLTFDWIDPLLRVGDRRPLRPKDIWQLSPYMSATITQRKWLELPAHWPLVGKLMYLNGLDIMLDGSLQTVVTVLGFAPALFTKQILEAISTGDPETKFDSVKWAILSIFTGLIALNFDVLHAYHARRADIRMQGQIISALMRKALLRTDMRGLVAAQDTKKEKDDNKKGKEVEDYSAASVGKVVNLMAGDTRSLANTLTWLWLLIELPVQLTVAMAFLFSLLGWAAFVGMAICVINIPLNNYLVSLNKTFTKDWRKAQDKRVDLTNTLVRSIRFIKASDLQTKWVDNIEAAREEELRLLKRRRINGIMLGMMWQIAPGLVILGSFWAYTNVLHRTLTIPVAFVSIQLFSGLAEPLGFLPTVMLQLTEAHVSLKRLETYFAEDEVEDRAVSLKRQPSLADPQTVSIEGTFSWKRHKASIDEQTNIKSSEDEEDPDLHLDLCQFSPGVTLIAGPTASGKSSLLSALLGEMHMHSGHVNLVKDNGNVAFCSQSPWIENASIKDNILFGHPYDQERYDAVIKATALETDLALFHHGDATDVGERGLSLSGGQQARIALAKAVYSPAKILILDDVLAAVDAHTGHHLVNNCFRGPLVQGKTIIFVTHHIELCSSVAIKVIRMEAGKILSQEDQTPREKVMTAQSKDTVVRPEHLASTEKLVKDEEVKEGTVSWSVYVTYIRAVGFKAWFVICSLLALLRFSEFGLQWIVKSWGESQATTSNIAAVFTTAHSQLVHHAYDHLNQYSSADGHVDTSSMSAADNADQFLLLYAGVFTFTVVLQVSIMGVLFWASVKASRKLFKELLLSVVTSTMRWFDGTPTGRILNRFADDFNKIDTGCPNSFRSLLSQIFLVLSSVIITASIMPMFLFLILFLLLAIYRLSGKYLRTSRALRRHLATAKSPIYSGFGELLHGITTIRAYGAESRYEKRNHKRLDFMNKLDSAYFMSNRWLLMRFEFLSILFSFGTFLVAIFGGLSAGLAAIAITTSQSLVRTCLGLIRMSAMLEQDLNSIERVITYINNDQEGPAIIEGSRPPLSWPSTTGGVEIENLCVRYNHDLPDVLKGLSFSIRPREKIGIVGRTGSGKSTFSLALLRFIEAHSGTITIDGIDISKIGLSDLRRNITVLQQDAILFEGTIRQNLDPFDEHDDYELWDVLYRCKMAGNESAAPSAKPSRAPSISDGIESTVRVKSPTFTNSDQTLVDTTRVRTLRSLDAPVAENGGNFSAGERQLLALARALLRRPKILLMDEASSSLDKSTDKHMQTFIREAFSDALIITIAHRLDTIIDYDRILVLDQGVIAECMGLIDEESFLFDVSRKPEGIGPSKRLFLRTGLRINRARRIIGEHWSIVILMQKQDASGSIDRAFLSRCWLLLYPPALWAASSICSLVSSNFVVHETISRIVFEDVISNNLLPFHELLTQSA